MDEQEKQATADFLQAFLKPWHESVSEAETAQRSVLGRLLKIYSETDYGREHGAERVTGIQQFRKSFPVMTYEDCKPLVKRVMEGNWRLMLHEEPLAWAITRGTTKGESKFIPMTMTDIGMRSSAGRAVMNYALQTTDFELFSGVNLNLNFPSVVGQIKAGERELEYGYSSGIYVKFVAKSTPIRSMPAQEEIDSLGGGKTLKDWENRFELAYQKCLKENVVLVGGVVQTALLFGGFLKRKHGVYPKDIWKVRVMTLGSAPGINTRYQPALKAMYGKAAIREIYGTTEGMFGQQRDEKKAWVPNYDLFFLEVDTGQEIKMLHEMAPGQMGSLIVSTTALARYRIGDIIRAFEPPYFRCIGRERWWTPLDYFWNEFMSFNLDRI